MTRIDDFSAERVNAGLAQLCNLIDCSKPSDGPMVRDILGGYLVLLSNIEITLRGADVDHHDRVVAVHKALRSGDYTILGKGSAN